MGDFIYAMRERETRWNGYYHLIFFRDCHMRKWLMEKGDRMNDDKLTKNKNDDRRQNIICVVRFSHQWKGLRVYRNPEKLCRFWLMNSISTAGFRGNWKAFDFLDDYDFPSRLFQGMTSIDRLLAFLFFFLEQADEMSFVRRVHHRLTKVVTNISTKWNSPCLPSIRSHSRKSIVSYFCHH